MSAIATPSSADGVIVGATGKHMRTLLVETWKKILRLQREAAAEGFSATFSCKSCHQPIRMTVPSKSDPRLECACTQWVGR